MKIVLQTDKRYCFIKAIIASLCVMFLFFILLDVYPNGFNLGMYSLIAAYVGYFVYQGVENRIIHITESGLEIQKGNYKEVWILGDSVEFRQGKFISNTFWLAVFDKKQVGTIMLGLKPQADSLGDFNKLIGA